MLDTMRVAPVILLLHEVPGEETARMTTALAKNGPPWLRVRLKRMRRGSRRVGEVIPGRVAYRHR